ncbi:SCO1860 family LAETG-anchored protein [Streptomyces longwoodensis]|uniref:SCO1860 family LAETG-anchored protein n=1 Tax=Streptomyces longwoodensis TaxID=68231 RepID=UPI0036FF4EA9
MNGTTFRMPARRLAAAAAATALAAGPAVLAGAAPAHATGDRGSARAAVLRTGLDVSLLNKTVQVPLALSLDEVRAPRSAEKTSLTATLDGVDEGRSFNVLKAEVARAEATVTADRAEASTRLARARLHVPGLPLLSLVELDAVTAKATCARGAAPVASATLPASVTVLGKRVSVTTGGTTDVKVPGVGEVRLDFAHRATTSRTAAATALRLRVTVNPLHLNVAEVEGTLTLAEAACEAPPPRPASHPAPKPEVKPQGAPQTADLAETGGTSVTPWLAAGATVLLATGAGAVALARRRN